MTEGTKRTANETFKQVRAEIDSQITGLQKALAELDEQQADSPNDWGFVGNATQVQVILDDALEFISQV